MRRPSREIDPAFRRSVKQALNFNQPIPTGQRHELLDLARQAAPGGPKDAAKFVEGMLVTQCEKLAGELRRTNEELGQVVERLTAPPHFPAVYLGPEGEGRALVGLGGGNERIVAVNEEVPDLEPGQDVVLNAERNIILGQAQRGKTGHLARFERVAESGHAIVNHRNEEVVCQVVNGLVVDDLMLGDSILIDPDHQLAIRKVEARKAAKLPYEVERVSDLRPEDIGGLDEQFEELLESLMISLHPDLAAAFELDGGPTVLVQGPPGGGKTRMAKVVAAELERRCKRQIRFVTVRPSEFRSMWHGETEAKIRGFFAEIRRLTEGSDGVHVVVFFDEAESLGKLRGGSRSHAFMDDHTNALLAELDGFQDLHNVSVISSTNRSDLLDPALRERLASVVITVPRPGMDAAREIFKVHMSERSRWASAGTREEAIEAALALIFMGDRNAVARIGFNEGSERVVKAGELLSGRLIRDLAANSRMTAARRAAGNGGGGGLEVDDVLEAVEGAIDGLRTTLSKENAHAYLADLPQDLAVVSVEPLHPKPDRPHRYLNA